MKKYPLFISLTVLVSLTQPVVSHAFNLPSLLSDEKKTEQQSPASPLIDSLSQSLGISSEQAAGGAGALLTQALGQMSKKNNNELNSLIPGMENLTNTLPGGLGALLNTSSDVSKIFTSLGLDPAMVSQFTPIIMKFLGEKGASSALLSELKGIWPK
ncbi:hypothetical protein CS022_01195 [Veronia nyctiphanis]|uniref:DUF2780 domain-containing protein n=1 Tax=Veronia nyctiphanis TaxID=1278244 RepID=A0A4Q0YVF4_9GAMM|nr:DUF2780 domain-containing protein [Veronia nyctiphanis]RXJ74853.1 hypothetical protein CS022_01195 [Veronia nyctiphanis]